MFCFIKEWKIWLSTIDVEYGLISKFDDLLLQVTNTNQLTD